MPVTLQISPPATGKTWSAIERVRSVLKANPLAPVWVVLPDRLQAQAFRERLARAGGAMGALVGTFGDVYNEILARTGKPIPVASDTILHRLIHGIVEELDRQGQLTHFSSLRSVPGFPKALRERFAELKRALVRPEVFVEESAGEEANIVELARLYLAYQTKLQDLHWADQEGLSWLAVEALETRPGLVQDWKLIVVDGFDDFNQTQLRALQLLAQQVSELLITLPGAQEMIRPVHSRFQHAFKDLCKDINPQVQSLASPLRLPDPLRMLESQLLESNPRKVAASPNLVLLEAQSPAEEAREVLRWIKAQLLRGQLSPSECAIFTPEAGEYVPPLREAAQEFGLPIRFTRGELLAEMPAISALLDLLKLPVLDYPRRLTLDGIRSPFFDLSGFRLSTRDCNLLEAASLNGQVIGGQEQWLSTLDALAGMPAKDQLPDLEENTQPQPYLPKGAEAGRLANAVRALMRRLQADEARSTRQWVEWLEDLLEEIHFIQQCEPPVMENLREVLRSLILSELVGGLRDFSYAEFIADLQNVLESSCFYPDTDWRQPAVLVGQILEARGVRFKAVAILGLSEGIFPTVERQDALLDESLRHRFGLDPRIGRHQASLFYQAVTRADQFLLLTRPYLAEGGEAWEPSHFWTSVKAIFPESVQRIKPDAPRSLLQAASREEALFWAVRQGLSPKSDPELIDRAQQVETARRVLLSRMSPRPQGPHEGYPLAIIPALASEYSAEHIWSASQFETYTSCPHRFFVENVLVLEAKQAPELGFDASQLGSMLHAILEGAYRLATDRASQESVLEKLREVAVQVFEQAPQKYAFRPNPLWESEKEHLVSTLEQSVIEMDKISQGWTPVLFEQAFGKPKTHQNPGSPFLELDTPIGKVHVRGFIDRLDCNDRGQYRVIDYKTGSSHLSKNDLIDGTRLQLPLYALAAEEALRVGEVVDGLYWSIKAAKPSLELRKFTFEDSQGIFAAVQLVLQHVDRAIRGIRQGAFPPAPPKSGCPGYCPAAAWCWRFTPGFTP
jgi:ATP-dependent helicase/DNAse subunit B